MAPKEPGFVGKWRVAQGSEGAIYIYIVLMIDEMRGGDGIVAVATVAI